MRAYTALTSSYFQARSACKRAMARAAAVLFGLALLAAAGNAAPPAAMRRPSSSQAGAVLKRS